jgi:phage replication O-like protein O
MANPQKENGYTPISHKILEALARQVISPDEWRVLMIIFRKTYGWDKKQDWISLGKFEEMTGILRQHVPRVLKRLIQRNIIIRGVTQTGSTVTHSGNTLEITYGFQKDFDKWKVLPKQVAVTQAGSRGATRSGKRVLPDQVPTIDNIQKITRKIASTLVDEEFWKQVREIYTWVDIDFQVQKMKGYQLTPKGRSWKMTRRSVIGWLNRIDKPLETPNEGDPYSHLPTIGE